MNISAKNYPMSDKQRNFIAALISQKFAPEAAATHLEWLNTHTMSSYTASAKIGELIKLDDVTPDTAYELEIGMYCVEGFIYKVQRAIRGSGNLYAKRWHVDTDEKNGGYFEMESGAIRKIRPEHRMSLENAAEFGHITGMCGHCGRTLTDEVSIAAGIGPICAGKY